MEDAWPREMLETVPYLRGQSFVRKAYSAYRSGWDHDHCAVCGATLTEPSMKGPDHVHQGYAITAEYEHGENYAWLCDGCFTAFKNEMDWKDVTPP